MCFRNPGRLEADWATASGFPGSLYSCHPPAAWAGLLMLPFAGIPFQHSRNLNSIPRPAAPGRVPLGV